MISMLRSILSIIVTVVAVLLALANRDIIAVVWSPVHDAINIPVFLLGLGAAVTGFIVGAGFAWMNGAAVRKDCRRQRKTIKRLEKKLQAADENKNTDDGMSHILIDNHS